MAARRASVMPLSRLIDRAQVRPTRAWLLRLTKLAKLSWYAADGGPYRRVDIFDGSFNLVRSFDDPSIPKGFTPYGIQTINGNIWVTFTSLKKRQGGFVDVFDAAGNLVRHFAVHGPLHSPWGIALAPADFGPMSNAILISNNISRGRINAFNPETGQFLGALRDANGKVIEVDNIWALQFGQDAAGGTRTVRTTNSSLQRARQLCKRPVWRDHGWTLEQRQFNSATI